MRFAHSASHVFVLKISMTNLFLNPKRVKQSHVTHKLNRWPKMAKNMRGSSEGHELDRLFSCYCWSSSRLGYETSAFISSALCRLFTTGVSTSPPTPGFQTLMKTHWSVSLCPFVWKIHLKYYFTRRQSALVIPYGYIWKTIICTELWECLKPPLISLDFTRQMRKRCNDLIQFIFSPVPV